MQSSFHSAPCIDDYFLEDFPLNLIKRQDFQRIPVMLGTNADEATFTTILAIRPEYLFREDPPFIGREEFKLVSMDILA